MSKTMLSIPIAKPWLGQEEAQAAQQAILSGCLIKLRNWDIGKEQ